MKLEESATGGGSDGNFTAALGVPTLDGLGGVGEGAHAANESILLDRIADRTALLAMLLVPALSRRRESRAPARLLRPQKQCADRATSGHLRSAPPPADRPNGSAAPLPPRPRNRSRSASLGAAARAWRLRRSRSFLRSPTPAGHPGVRASVPTARASPRSIARSSASAGIWSQRSSTRLRSVVSSAW